MPFDGINRPYVSGQISGLAHEEFVANFARGFALLERQGMSPFNPLTVVACPGKDCQAPNDDLNGEYLHTWQCYMKYDIQALIIECDSIAMLPNWNESRGAKLELHIARELHYPVLFVSRGYKTLTRGVGI
jgi:hypothetical protein